MENSINNSNSFYFFQKKVEGRVMFSKSDIIESMIHENADGVVEELQ